MTHPLNTEGYSRGDVWCVPSAVSLLTGKLLVETAQRLASIRDQRYADLEGVWTEEAVLLLYEYGYRATAVPVVERFKDTVCGPTLRRFMEERQPMEVVNPLLIELDTHVVVSHFSFLFDNWVPKGAQIESFPKPTRLVKAAWIITKDERTPNAV